MAPITTKKRGGRAAAEAAYAEMLADSRALVGDVGAAHEAFAAAHAAAVTAQKAYEDARAAAIKAGAINGDQLDQMGYRKTPKLPALPTGDSDDDRPQTKTERRPGGEDRAASKNPPRQPGAGEDRPQSKADSGPGGLAGGDHGVTTANEVSGDLIGTSA